MKPERNFIAQRPLAQHCTELMRTGPGLAELLPHLESAGERLARMLAIALAPLLGGEIPAVRSGVSRACDAGGLMVEVAPLAANSLMVAGPHDALLLVSIDAGAVLRMVDRAFGGKGTAPSPMPESFPISAELMVARLEVLIAAHMATALGVEGESTIRPLRRDGSLQELAPFAAECPLGTICLSITESQCEPWEILLAFPVPTLAALLGQGQRQPAARSAVSGPADPASEPFGDVPLPLSAVLVDMRMAVSAISQIGPGTILPVAVARSVPLRIGEKAIAHGTIGALDDRVAVQIIKAF